MNKFTALALAAAFGLATLGAPIVSAEAATMKKMPAKHHMMAKEPAMACHMVKEKDGKMHKLCHHVHAMKAHGMKKMHAKKK